MSNTLPATFDPTTTGQSIPVSIPTAASIPSALHRHIASLERGQEDFAKLSIGLSRLTTYENLQQQQTDRQMVEVTDDLKRLHKDLLAESDRFGGSLERLIKEFGTFKQETTARVSTALGSIASYQSQGRSKHREQFKACALDLKENILSIERDSIRRESHIRCRRQSGVRQCCRRQSCTLSGINPSASLPSSSSSVAFPSFLPSGPQPARLVAPFPALL
ncbi:hypothetical protein V8E36_002728 [Tilletia maclaganii]